MTEHKHDELIIVCSHVLKECKEPMRDEFPDLICLSCQQTLADETLPLPKETGLMCKECVKKYTYRKLK